MIEEADQGNNRINNSLLPISHSKQTLGIPYQTERISNAFVLQLR